MSGDEDDSDWLSGQFDATEQVPAQPVAPPTVTPPTVTPPTVTPPVVTPPVAAPPAVTPTIPVAAAPAAAAPFPFKLGGAARPSANAASAPAPPVVPPPAPLTPPPPVVSRPPVAPTSSDPAIAAPNAGDRFSWGLKPGGVVSEPAPAASGPDTGPPTEPHVAEPTKPLSWDEFASTQQQVAPAASPAEQPTEAYTVQPWLPAAASPVAQEQPPVDPANQSSAIDSLFGDHKFQDYDELGVLKTLQVPPPAVVVVQPDLREPHEPLSSTQRVLLGVAGGLIAALILVGLFFLGQHLGIASAAVPVPTATGAASSVIPSPAGTGGPAAPGVRQWTALQGGECIQPFSSAWANTFTVVACTADHDAEMVFKGKLPEGASAKYPSATSFQAQLTPLCSAPTAISYAAAASVTDLQVSFSYPPDTESWLKGDRTYYCFVDRVSGGNLPGDLAVAKTQ